jgi:hypothetical protein
MARFEPQDTLTDLICDLFVSIWPRRAASFRGPGQAAESSSRGLIAGSRGDRALNNVDLGLSVNDRRPASQATPVDLRNARSR